MKYTERLALDLKRLGIVPGDVVLMHTSLKALDTPGLRAEDVIETLLRAFDTGRDAARTRAFLSDGYTGKSCVRYKTDKKLHRRAARMFPHSICTVSECASYAFRLCMGALCLQCDSLA